MTILEPNVGISVICITLADQLFCNSFRLLTIKGAPDVLMTRCTHYTDSTGTMHRLDEDMLASLEQLKNNYSSQGKRCLLLARKTLSAGTLADEADSTNYEAQVTEQARTGLTLVGMVAIIDPLRPEIQDVVSTLRGAGIRIAMVCLPPVIPIPSITYADGE